MTDDRSKIIRLAEGVMGWKLVECALRLMAETERGSLHIAESEGWAENFTIPCTPLTTVWNPFESPADGREMEGSIPEDKREEYIGWLECECVHGLFDPNNPAHQFALAHATYRQRCEAALKTLEAR